MTAEVMPDSAGTWRRDNSRASRPPAGVPMPTMGNIGRPGGGRGNLLEWFFMASHLVVVSVIVCQDICIIPWM